MSYTQLDRTQLLKGARFREPSIQPLDYDTLLGRVDRIVSAESPNVQSKSYYKAFLQENWEATLNGL